MLLFSNILLLVSAVTSRRGFTILFNRVAIIILLYYSIISSDTEIGIYNGLFLPLTLGVIPVVSYSNTDLDKKSIIKENRGKSGVYVWTNKVNGKSYVGSSTNLTIRFNCYFNKSRLGLGSGKHMLINKALLKHGHSNFRLEILEYCDKDKAIIREQYYLDKLNPEYNILKIAGSCFGHKHSEESKAKMRKAALGRVFSEETKAKLKDASLGRKLRLSTILKLRSYRHTEEAIIKIRAGNKKSISVQVTDLETNELAEYSSMRQAAKQLNTTSATIGSYLKNKKPYLNRYLINCKSKANN